MRRTEAAISILGNNLIPPTAPWKSQWRKDFERGMQEQRIRIVPKPASPRTDSKPQRARKPQTPKPSLKRYCARRGRHVRKRGASECSLCRDLVHHERCKEPGCKRELNANNTTGYCKPHWIRRRRLRPYRSCGYQADGMACAQRIYQKNPTGLCVFHNGKSRDGIYSKYRDRKPKMVPLRVE